LVSIRFDRKGPWKAFEARDSSTNTLKRANDMAIRRVRTPAMRTA
jgi:hypothetical protein